MPRLPRKNPVSRCLRSTGAVTAPTWQHARARTSDFLRIAAHSSGDRLRVTNGRSPCCGEAGRFFSSWSGSVSGVLSLDDHLSGTDVAVGLKRAYPSAGWASLDRSYLPLLRMGFAKPPRCRDAGALLPHRFSFSPASEPAGESSFLWHFPSAHAAQPLAGILPCGAPTFLTSPEGTARPSDPLRGRF